MRAEDHHRLRKSWPLVLKGAGSRRAGDGVATPRRIVRPYKSKSCFRRRPTLLEFEIALVAAVATLADFRVWVHLLPLQGAEIGAGGDDTSAPVVSRAVMNFRSSFRRGLCVPDGAPVRSHSAGRAMGWPLSGRAS